MPRLDNFKSSIRNDNDELYTPRILVDVIVPYVKKDQVVWCPFDTENSEFVIAFKEAGIKVIYSHIMYGQDFLEYEPEEHYDLIISNPPFTIKLLVFERLYQLGKPFAVIMGLPILNYQEVGDFFFHKNSDIQLCIVNKKVSFNGNTASFNNSYFCRNFLPKDIEFTALEHNNTKEIELSRMYVDQRDIKLFMINKRLKEVAREIMNTPYNRVKPTKKMTVLLKEEKELNSLKIELLNEEQK